MDTRYEQPAPDGESQRATIIGQAQQQSAPQPSALGRASSGDASHPPSGRRLTARERPDHEKTKKALVKDIAELRAYVAELEEALASNAGEVAPGSQVVEFPVRKPGRDTSLPAPISGELEAQRTQTYRYVRHQFELLRAITDSLGEGVYALDHTGKVSFINSAALSMLGYEKSDLLYRNMHERIHYLRPDGTPCPVEECPMMRAMNTGEKYRRAEDVFIRADGSMLPVSYVATPIFGDGAISGVVVAFHDITERKNLEDELRSSEQRFRVIFEQAGVGIAQVGPTGRYLLLNQRYGDIMGYTPSELRERRFQDITHPDDVAENTRGFAALVAKDLAAYTTEKRFIRKDGAIVWASITVVPVYGTSGELVYLNTVVEDISERKRLEAEIAQLLVSEQSARIEADTRASELEAIFNAMADGVVLYDAEGNMRQINPAGRALLALDHQPDYFSHPGRDRSWQLHMRDEDGKPLRQDEWPYMRLLRGETLKEADAVDALTRNLAGEDRSYSYSGAPLRDAEGRIVGAVMVFRDVTERRRLEREAEQRASQLEAVFEAIGDGIFVYDAAGRILHRNAADRTLFQPGGAQTDLPDTIYERTKQLTMLDAEGKPLAREEWPSFRTLRGEVFTGATTLDLKWRRPNGSESFINIAGSPVRDHDGHILGGVIVWRDMTERRRLEQRTRDALTALLAMAEAMVQVPDNTDLAASLSDEQAAPMPESASGYATNSVALHFAKLLRTVLGCEFVSIAALASLQPVAVVGLTPEMERQWREDIQHSTPEDYLENEELDILTRGEPIIRDLSVRPFRNRPDYGVRVVFVAPMRIGEHLLGVIGVEHRDTTHTYTDDEMEIILAAAKLAAVVFERERLVREREEARTNELALREVNRRTDEFLSIASHELKTPLTSILLTFHLLHSRMRMLEAASGDASEQHRLLQTVGMVLDRADQQGARMDRLIDDLLDVSRIRMNRFDLRPQTCDLVAIVREAVHEQEMHHPSRTLTFDVPSGVMLVMADSMRIGQVVTNYLTNALKYAPEDQPIAVSLRREGQDARVTVRDLGPGLTPTEQQTIWERFHRAEDISVVSGSEVGLGLGLYICRTIVERHGGQVGVESTPGEGSSFWFTLPL